MLHLYIVPLISLFSTGRENFHLSQTLVGIIVRGYVSNQEKKIEVKIQLHPTNKLPSFKQLCFGSINMTLF